MSAPRSLERRMLRQWPCGPGHTDPDVPGTAGAIA